MCCPEILKTSSVFFFLNSDSGYIMLIFSMRKDEDQERTSEHQLH